MNVLNSLLKHDEPVEDSQEENKSLETPHEVKVAIVPKASAVKLVIEDRDDQ